MTGEPDPVGAGPPPASDAPAVAAPAQPVTDPVPANEPQAPAELTPEAVQAAEQSATADAASVATTTASQTAPTNLNVVIRVNSPGDDGPVTQSNTAGGGLGAAPAGGATAPAGTGVSVAPTASETLPTTWIWNWTWSAVDCASGLSSPPQSVVADGTWTWTWSWGCAPAPPPRLQVVLPTVAAPSHISDARSGGQLQTAAPPARAAMIPRIARNSGPSQAVGPREGVDGPHGPGAAVRNPFIRVLRGVDVAAQRASAAARRAATASARALGGSSRDAVPPVGLIAPAATAIASAGPSASGGGLVAAALLAMLAFLAPQLLLPLWTASVRRPGSVSSRRERPG